MFIYDPQNASIEELELTLTRERRVLAKRLMTHYQAAFDKQCSHYVLVVAPRGGGKTHLLTYTWQKLIQNNHEQLSVIHLSEEERGITSYLDMMLAILNAMEDAPENYRELIRSGGTDEIDSRAETIIDEALNEKQVLLVVENLSVLFQGMSTQDLHALRAFFQRHPCLSIIASTITLFNESKKADHPFYGFFKIHPIKALNVEDATSYLRQMAELKKDQELVTLLQQPEGRHRVAAIHALTGGNHRLLALLSGFLDAEGLDELVSPFIRLVDRELTPYYQQRLDRLSPLQNKILNAIAAHHGRAITVKEIADYTFTTSQTVSGQLRSLLHECYVQRSPVGRESCYELREPLMRLVLDIKERRDRPLPLIVSFLRQWHQMEELQNLLSHCPPGSKCYYEAAINAANHQQFDTNKFTNKQYRLYSKKLINWKKRSINPIELGLLDVLLTGVSHEDAGRFDDAFEVYQQGLASNVAESDVPLHAHLLFRKGLSLRQMGRLDEALSVYDEIIELYKDAVEPEIQEWVVGAKINRAVALDQMGRLDEALEACQTSREAIVSNGPKEKLERLQLLLAGEERYIRILLQQGDYNKSIHYLEKHIANNDEEFGEIYIRILATRMLDEFVLTAGVLDRLLKLLQTREKILDNALILWVQLHVPGLKENRPLFAQKAKCLLEALEGTSVSELSLNVITAMRRYVEGDKKALLELPKEIRQLIEVDMEE